MTEYFYAHPIRIFDYPEGAEPLRDAIRENHGGHSGRERNRDRVGIEQEEFPQGATGQRDSGETRERAGAGVHCFGHGTVRSLQTVAREEEAQDVPEAGRRQMPARLRRSVAPVVLKDGDEAPDSRVPLRFCYTTTVCFEGPDCVGIRGR